MLLELKNIKKYFPSHIGFFGKVSSFVKAADGVDLTIVEGENFGLVGESGCGKTTLGRLAIKLLLCDSGEIIFKGRNIANLSAKKMRVFRQDIQMVFQDPFTSLDPRFTVRNILSEAMQFQKESLVKKEERMKELLLAVRLPADILGRFPHEFSGGERQRIAIARALSMNPKLLILDEAVSSLDVLVQEEILNLLLDLQQKFNVTYFFISHNLRVVKKICHKVAVMLNGRIVERGPCGEIFSNPLHPYTKQLLSAAIEYKVASNQKNIVLKENAKLIDQGGGHFVLEN
ncbi:MAG: ATP-binding cassette domain-containing protein [Candidatus Aceula meridiana]|nr:ATP-binding cassette domain-containing protein [Candidatus Aceula meridiana]